MSYFGHVLFNNFKMRGLPPVISIEPTNRCNLHCLQCHVGTDSLARKRGEMDVSLFQYIVDSVKDHLIYMMLYFQGEPFLHRDIALMIQYARKRNIYVVLNTNGHFINTIEDGERIVNSGLHRIIFSLDGATEKSYTMYRSGGNFSAVTEGIRKLAEAKKSLKSANPKISIQFIVMKHNENEIEDIKQLAMSLGADNVLLKSVQVYDDQGYENLLPSLEHFRRYKKTKDRIVLKKLLKNRCLRILTTPVITWDGRMLSCCFDKDGRYSYGSLTDGRSFKDVWMSKDADDFRKKVFTNRIKIDICNNCI
ncbi:radical SAM/SPASM domain-containing protein [candidate division KSB1 bacterium]